MIRLNLPFGLEWLILVIWTLLSLVLLAFVALVISKAWRQFMGWRVERRRKELSPAIDLLLAGDEAAVADMLRPRFWGDAAIVEEMLVETFAYVRGPLAESVVRIAEEIGLVERRLRQLKSRALHRRAEAADRLGLLRAKRAVPALLEALSSGEHILRIVAARALGRIQDPQAILMLLDALERNPGQAGNAILQAVAGFGEEAVPAILERLRKEGKVHVRLIELLGDMRVQDALADLVTALKTDTDPMVRAASAGALGKIGDPFAVAALRQGFQDPAPEVRIQSVRALGRIRDPSASQDLDRALDDQNWWVRVRSAEALALLGPQGWAVLERRRKSHDTALRNLVGEMLTLGGGR